MHFLNLEYLSIVDKTDKIGKREIIYLVLYLLSPFRVSRKRFRNFELRALAIKYETYIVFHRERIEYCYLASSPFDDSAMI